MTDWIELYNPSPTPTSLAGKSLTEALKRRAAEEPIQVTVICPISNPREGYVIYEDSVRSAAEVLICHPNTVRHRLRRIEKRTGRSLSRPKDVAELCLAFEVHRRLM